MIDIMFERIADLPQWAQIFLITLFFLGSGGGILSVVMSYLKSVNDGRHKERLEVVENNQIKIQNEQIKIQSEAAQAAAHSLNTQKLIEVIAASNDRFQKVIDAKSERQLEADKLQHETNKMFLDAVNRQTFVVSNLTEMLEIQSEQLGNLVKTVDGVDTSVKANLQTMEQLARDNRSDITTALGLSVTHRTESENALRVIQQSIHGIAKDVRDIISANEDLNKQTLLAINAKLQSLENNVSTLIAPRTTLPADALPQPGTLTQPIETDPNTNAGTVPAEETKQP